MCQFVSWIEYKNETLFITKKKLETTKGKKLRKYLGPQFENDIKGHGAIRYYYNLKANQGRDRERSDFSSPKNFPAPVVKAIKSGLFVGIATEPSLLTKPAREEYEKIEQPAWEEYEKIRQTARAEYEKIRQPARAEYGKIRQTARAEYEKIEQTAFWRIFKLKKNRRKEWE